MTLRLNGKNKDVLIISDTHFPHHHPDTIPFLKAIKKKIAPKLVIHIGDEVDNCFISFHTSPSSLSGDQELSDAVVGLQNLRKLFDKMYILDSNHGSLIFRRMKAEKIPLTYIKPLQEIYGTPNWSWHHDIILDTKHDYPTYFCHGKQKGYNKLSNSMGMNAVQGHYHSLFEITYARSVVGERYNMFVGAFANDKEIAMEYAKNNVPKTILGCGYIDKEGTPHLLKMNLNKKGRWDKKVTIV